jgi:hypothetical protein
MLDRHTNGATVTTKKSKKGTFDSSNKGNAIFGSLETTSTQVNKTPAMASLYPETTVFFADLAGFTAWSRYVYIVVSFYIWSWYTILHM